MGRYTNKGDKHDEDAGQDIKVQSRLYNTEGQQSGAGCGRAG